MKKITYFYLEGCPYCHQADKLVSELLRKILNSQTFDSTELSTAV